MEPTRAGARRAERPKRQFQPRLAGIAAAAVVSLVAWGFLVWAAIDFGRSARGGDGTAWVFLAIASIGAVACLFLSLMLATMLLRAVGHPRGEEAAQALSRWLPVRQPPDELQARPGVVDRRRP